MSHQVADVEGKLPPKVPVVVKCAMSAYQATIYDWVKATGTIRVDPAHPRRPNLRHDWEPLQNKVMELRKVRVVSLSTRSLCRLSWNGRFPFCV